MTTAERARSLKKPPVYVLGCGQAITHANISSMPDLTVTGALAVGTCRVRRWPRLGPGDIDVVELYDAFTINTILFLEDLGFCPKGRGRPLRIRRPYRAQAAVCRSTPMAAASPIAIPACTGCFC